MSAHSDTPHSGVFITSGFGARRRSLCVGPHQLARPNIRYRVAGISTAQDTRTGTRGHGERRLRTSSRHTQVRITAEQRRAHRTGQPSHPTGAGRRRQPAAGTRTRPGPVRGVRCRHGCCKSEKRARPRVQRDTIKVPISYWYRNDTIQLVAEPEPAPCATSRSPPPRRRAPTHPSPRSPWRGGENRPPSA